MIILIIVVVTVALMSVGAIMNGWALSVLWGWFIAPTFNLPELTLVQAIGVGMVVSYLTYQYIDTRAKDESDAAKITPAVIMVIARPICAVGIGWVVHSFM